MRIGTWNLAGRWSDARAEFLTSLECDLLLLTEVHHETRLPGMRGRTTYGLMAPDRFWAGVFSTGAQIGYPDPHPAAAMAVVDGVTCCSSVLPWRSCGTGHPWVGERHADKTAQAVAPIARLRSPVIWGGDWNHALEGTDHVGSREGRGHIFAVLDALGLQVPTADLDAHRGERSVDHIAFPKDWVVVSADQVPAVEGSKRLSDHDAYVVELEA
ncbi:MAG TPA: endonuclease/exonuclease/phosphatase family protein [Nocardioides sp.]|nr:endonuclease/exonuclease/phosphatase family protein [Nocardioides sp.]